MKNWVFAGLGAQEIKMQHVHRFGLERRCKFILQNVAETDKKQKAKKHNQQYLCVCVWVDDCQKNINLLIVCAAQHSCQ